MVSGISKAEKRWQGLDGMDIILDEHDGQEKA